MAEFKDLLGKTLVKIEGGKGSREIIFTDTTGKRWIQYHNQDCCEIVTVEDIIGDLKDLIGSPIAMAEEATNSTENPEGIKKDYQESFTWTFYKLATIKGYVTIRWYGTSNGYYSERVDFEELKEGN